MVIEEFGKEVNSSVADLTEENRLAYYKLIYFEVQESFSSGGPLQGVLFWRCRPMLLSTKGSTLAAARVYRPRTGPAQQQPVVALLEQDQGCAAAPGSFPGPGKPALPVASGLRRLRGPGLVVTAG